VLFPDASASIAYLWTPRFGSKQLRRRLRLSARTIGELSHAIEQEGGREAEQLVAMGVTVARAAGWDVEPLVKSNLGGGRLEPVAGCRGASSRCGCSRLPRAERHRSVAR